MLFLLALPLLQDPLPEKLHPIQVTVNEALSGAPVAEAELRWVSMDTQHFGTRSAEPDTFGILVRDDLFAEGSPVAKTNAEGRASLAHVEHTGFVCVSRGAERGCARVRPGQEGEIAVRLLRDWPLEVEVVDPAGAALDGLGVCLSYAIGDGGERRDAFSTRVPIVHGIARIEHAGFYQGAREAGCAFHAGLTGWIGKPVQAWLPTFEPPDAPVRLTLPAHGSLRVAVFDEEGRPAGAVDPLWIGEPALLPADVAWPVAPNALLLGGGQGYLVQPLEKGAVLLNHVALGSKLLARVRRNEHSSPSTNECAGPVRAGETAQAALRLGSGCGTLRGRVDVPDGLKFDEFPLAPDGRFVFDLDPARLAAMKQQLGFRANSADKQRVAAWYLWLDAPWGIGLHDLGDVVLDERPILAAGRVIDSHTRAGLEGVRVQQLPAPPPEWPSHAVLSDPSGNFELRDSEIWDEPTLEFSIAVEGGPPIVKKQKVHLGARQLVIELDTR